MGTSTWFYCTCVVSDYICSCFMSADKVMMRVGLGLNGFKLRFKEVFFSRSSADWIEGLILGEVNISLYMVYIYILISHNHKTLQGARPENTGTRPLCRVHYAVARLPKFKI